MKRGDIVTVSAQGDYGKPRPAVVAQSDFLSVTDSVLIIPLTSTLRDGSNFPSHDRTFVRKRLENRLQVMVDKIMVVPRRKCGAIIGRLDRRQLTALNQMSSVVLGFVG